MIYIRLALVTPRRIGGWRPWLWYLSNNIHGDLGFDPWICSIILGTVIEIGWGRSDHGIFAWDDKMMGRGR